MTKEIDTLYALTIKLDKEVDLLDGKIASAITKISPSLNLRKLGELDVESFESADRAALKKGGADKEQADAIVAKHLAAFKKIVLPLANQYQAKLKQRNVEQSNLRKLILARQAELDKQTYAITAEVRRLDKMMDSL